MIYDKSGSGPSGEWQCPKSASVSRISHRRSDTRGEETRSNNPECGVSLVSDCSGVSSLVALWLRSHSDLNIRNCLEYCEM